MNEAEQEKTPAQGIWCGKMCPELSAPTKEPISASCFKKPQKWPANKPPLFLSLKTDGLQPDALPMWEDNGALRGEYLMHSFGVCPKDENASHLSQILEASPHPKYSLSARACLGILNRAEKRGKQLPEILKLALIQQAQRGGLGKLDCVSILERRTSNRHPHSKERRGGNGCQTNKILIV